jgi:LuxR family maltose regulon positive regulatory protein
MAQTHAKVTRPTLPPVFPRERLFTTIDDVRSRPVMWISGPAGCGKTTLVASYLEARKLPCLWYQMDAGDADAATFFYYMGLAVKQASPRKRKPLPLLTPEYMLGLDTFAVRYFEAVYQRLSTPMVLVIDNYQLIPPESILHTLMLNGLSVIPEGVTVILISRKNPPPAFSRMLANQEITHIGWQQLQLTQDETAGIASLQTKKTLSEETIRHLHEAADGWTAGLMLMLAQADLEGMDWQSIQRFTPQEIFDYFGKEVFEREPPETQEFLLTVSFLPHMTPKMAATLTNQSRAGKILAQLNRNNRFTERRLQKRLSYQFHPLFREFLLSRAHETYSEKVRVDLRRTAAMLLQAEGDIEEAAALLRDAKAWDALADLIVNHASSLISQGRNQTLLEWLGVLPEEMITEIPWLEYWMGTALTPFDPEASQGHLEKAFHVFRSLKDAAGLFLSWSGIMEAIFFKKGDLCSFDPWIEVLEELMSEYHHFPSKEIEGKVTFNMILALGHRHIHHPKITSWVDRAVSLLSGPLDLNTKVSLVTNIVPYCVLMGDYSKAAQAIDLLGPVALSSQGESKHPLPNIFLALTSSLYYGSIGMHAECLNSVSQGLAISRRTGISILDNLIACWGIWSAISHEEYVTARELFEQHAVAMVNAPPFELGFIEFIRSIEAMGLGDLKQAAVHAASSLKLSLDLGCQYSTILDYLISARIMHEMGRHTEADEHLKEALRLSEPTHIRHLLFHAQMLKARFALDQGHQEAGLASLRKALALGKEIGLYHNMIESRSAIARLLAVALEHGIEEAYATDYIRKRSLAPETPPVHLDKWPWPVKIYTLGGFKLLRDDQPVRFSGKAQRRPLAMLQAIIAFGGRDIREEALTDALWPESEGDLAHQSYATTLHRLRRLIDLPDAILRRENRVTVDPLLCWVDLWAFEGLLDKADAAWATGGEDEEFLEAIATTDKAVALYEGPFLASEGPPPWCLPVRERVRGRFLRAVRKVGEFWYEQNQWERAADWYERALAKDAFIEEFYRHLMSCYHRMNYREQVILVYERCCAALAAVQGTSPSPETQALKQQLVPE